MQRNSFSNPKRGLSLIECCVTLAIASILVGTAVPSFQETKNKLVVEGLAGELATDLRYVRSEAVARNEGIRISFRSVPAGTCTLIHTGANADCGCDAGGVAQCSNGATLLKAQFHANQGRVAVAANVASMRFDPINGTVTPAGSVTVTSANGLAVRHVVNIMGRVRSCSPGGTVKQMKPG